MRRMYSERELTKIIEDVLDGEIESGTFDEKVSDAVDAYLVEHPVDITALVGKDVSLKTLSSTGDVSVGEDLAVVGNITGSSIIENMSGYSTQFGSSQSSHELEQIYTSACKNGNKLTLVTAFNITRLDTISNDFVNVYIYVPTAVFNSLIPVNVAGYLYLALGNTPAYAGELSEHNIGYAIRKQTSGANAISFWIKKTSLNQLELNTKYYIRIECTLLLSDNMVP